MGSDQECQLSQVELYYQEEGQKEDIVYLHNKSFKNDNYFKKKRKILTECRMTENMLYVKIL